MGDMKTESLRTKVSDIKVSDFPNVRLCYDLFRHSEAALAQRHTFNPRLAVPQQERMSELVTLACYERPSTPPQSPLSRGSLEDGKHCCGTLTSQRPAS